MSEIPQFEEEEIRRQEEKTYDEDGGLSIKEKADKRLIQKLVKSFLEIRNKEKNGELGSRQAAQTTDHLKKLSIEHFGSEVVLQMEEARQIIGEKNFLGLEAIKKAIGVEVDSKEIPPIPFSIEELEGCEDRGEFLILRNNRTSNGEPLTIAQMKPALLDEDDMSKNDDFVTKEVPRPGWALVTKEFVPGTIIDYINQTDVLVDRLSVVYPDKIPSDYEEAALQYRQARPQLVELVTGKGHSYDTKSQAARMISELDITKLLRPTAVEAFYDCLVFESHTGKPLLPGNLTMTGTFYERSITLSIYVGSKSWGQKPDELRFSGMQAFDWDPEYGGALMSRIK